MFTTNSSAGNSERFSHKHANLIKDKNAVDDYSIFREAGWFCIVAYKNKERVFYAHCNDSEQFDNTMNGINSYKKFDRRI
jgi:hypothetical protein